MPTADEVIVEFEARIGKYEADLRRAAKTFEATTRTQEQRIKHLERQMQASTSRIAMTLRGLAGTFATYFTGRELVGLMDGFTRLQNELRVAGLEGEALTGVQERLFQIANENGTAINSLAELYGKSASAARDFGASQAQMLTLTEASALALRISGTNAQTASGALLGLSQALASGTVRAEEFNQMNEGGLRPLLQAAAASERFGGSLGKLRNAVVEGEVTSRQFFDAVLQGSAQLRDQAANANLTLAGAFTTLNNKLIEYVGGAASANGVTGSLATGINLLADNLDTVIEALAVIGGVMLARYVSGMVAAGAATASTSNIIFAMQARALGAATTMEALAFAGRSAGTALLAAFGGPVGAAVTALTLGIGYLAVTNAEAAAAANQLSASIEAQAAEFDILTQKQREADAEANRLDATQRSALTSTANLTGQAHLLANAWGRVAAEAKRAAIEQARAAQAKAAANLRDTETAILSAGTRGFYALATPEVQEAQRDAARRGPLGKQVQDARANYLAATRELRELEQRLLEDFRGGSVTTSTASIGGGKSAKPTAVRTPRDTGPTTADIAARFDDEMDSYRSQMAAAQSQMARSAEERAELELKGVDIAERATVRAIMADEHYSDLDKQRLSAAAEMVAVIQREAIEFSKRVQIEQEALQIADERARAEADALRLQYDLATTESDRRRIAHQILDAEDAYLKSKLEAVIASETATEAEKERARIALASLEATSGARHRVADRAHQGALGRYLDDTADTAARAEEAAVREMEALRDGLAEGLADQLGTKNQFVRDLFSIFLDEVIFRPLAESLRNAGGGGGLIGGLVGLVGGLFGGGRAIGGPVRPGRAYMVGENGPEPFVPQQAGVIVPNRRLQAQGGGTTVISSPQFDLRGAVVTAELYADMERISRFNAAQAGGKAYHKALKDVPARMSGYQRYGK